MSTTGSGITPSLGLGDALTEKFDSIRKSVESIRTWNTIPAYIRLKRAERDRKNLEGQTNQLYRDCQSKLNSSLIFLPAVTANAFAAVTGQVTQQLVELVKASQAGGLTILSVLRAQEASQSLGALIERKHAYTFGLFSLYIALVSLAVGVFGIYVTLPGPEVRPAIESRQAFFRVHESIRFTPGFAEVKDKLNKIDLTRDICDAQRELTAAESKVAFVVGRHDQTPLSRKARLAFSSNAGLAQRRAEAVAAILGGSTDCGQPIPTVISLVGAPRNVGERSNQPARLQEDRDVTIYGLGRPHESNRDMPRPLPPKTK